MYQGKNPLQRIASDRRLVGRTAVACGLQLLQADEREGNAALPRVTYDAATLCATR